MKYLQSLMLALAIWGIAITTKPMIQYPLSAQEQAILRSFLQKEMPAQLMDALWEKVFYWFTFYESPDGWDLTGTPAFVSGELSMTANNSTAAIAKATNKRNLLKWDKDQRMRMNVIIDNTANVTSLMVIGQEQAGGVILSHFGFKVANGRLLGIAGDAGTAAQSSVNLMAVTANTVYEIEARYSVGDKILFYVDDVQKGTLTTNLPKTDNGSGYNPQMLEIVQTSLTAANRTLISSYFEYIRLK